MKLVEIQHNKSYYVTKDGRVFSKYGLKTKELSQFCKDGYKKLGIRIEKKKKNFFVHRMVALTYLNNPDNLPEVNHINGVREDNRVKNLEWCTKAENRAHAIKSGLYPKEKMPKKIKQLSREGEIIKIWPSAYNAGKNGFNEKRIGDCLKGRRGSHKKFRWEYVK